MKLEGKVTLENSAMAFQLKDGNVVLISQEDISEMAAKIIAFGLVHTGGITLIANKDTNATKADTLIRLIASQPNMPEDLKRQYLEEILKLLTTVGEKQEETLIDKGSPIRTHVEQTEHNEYVPIRRGRPRKEINA